MSQCIIHWCSKERYQNDKQATSNKQQATSNKQQATSNKQQATSNKQQATYKPFPKFLEQVVDQGQHSFHVCKKYFLIGVFAILMVSISCGGGGPSSVATTPPDGGSKQFDPICTNGVASTTKVSTANTEKCTSCDPSFDLNGEICGGFDFTCDGGVESTGKSPKKNIEKCTSCDKYYAFKRDKTCAVVMVSTLAGTGIRGFMDDAGGASGVAKFDGPVGVAVDGSGNVYVADAFNHRIRKIKISMGGVAQVVTWAGEGTGAGGGFGSGAFSEGAGGVAQFDTPYGVAVDGVGVVYVADRRNHRIRKITSEEIISNRTVSTLAGTGTKANGDPGGDFNDGAGPSSNNPSGVAQFNQPVGVVVDGSGNVYVADSSNHRIRRVTPAGEVDTLAGTGTGGFVDSADGSAKFDGPVGVAVDSDGNVYVADSSNNRIRKIKISMDGVGNEVITVSTLAGTGTIGFKDGAGNVAQFSNPSGVAVDGSGNVYVVDVFSHSIRKVTPAGEVSTLAGTRTKGFKDGAGNVAQFSNPSGVAVNVAGDVVYVADRQNHRIRKLTIPQ